MDKFFKKHPDLILVSLTVIFLGLLVGYYFWGIGILVQHLNRAINTSQGGSTAVGFDMAGAKSLNLKGLVQ